MALSVGTVCLLFAWCMFKVMRKPTEPEHMQQISADFVEGELIEVLD
ncbi:MAG: hypothetical protein AAGF10_05855 [Verrucomicrobiota bacterium]